MGNGLGYGSLKLNAYADIYIKQYNYSQRKRAGLESKFVWVNSVYYSDIHKNDSVCYLIKFNQETPPCPP